MKTLNIGGNDYIIEFTFEAAMNSPCVESVMRFMSAVSETDSSIETIIPTMSSLPSTAMSMFRAGLLEHYDFDMQTTKELVKALFAQERKKAEEDETYSGITDFYGLMAFCVEAMTDDGFFDLIGLSSMTATARTQKTPQDHKKKSRKTSPSEM